MSDADWIECCGNINPAPGKTIHVRFEGGVESNFANLSDKYIWGAGDIIAYRVVSEPPKPAPIASDAAEGLRERLERVALQLERGVTPSVLGDCAREVRAILTLSAPPVHAGEAVRWQVRHTGHPDNRWLDYSGPGRPDAFAEKPQFEIRALGVIEHPASGEDVGQCSGNPGELDSAEDVEGLTAHFQDLWDRCLCSTAPFNARQWATETLAALSNRRKS